MTARCLDDRKLDLGTFDSSDFTGHFASLMRGMWKLEPENVAPKCERSLKSSRPRCLCGRRQECEMGAFLVVLIA